MQVPPPEFSHQEHPAEASSKHDVQSVLSSQANKVSVSNSDRGITACVGRHVAGRVSVLASLVVATPKATRIGNTLRASVVNVAS